MKQKRLGAVALVMILVLAACGGLPDRETPEDSGGSFSERRQETIRPGSYAEPHVLTVADTPYETGSTQDWEYALYDCGAAVLKYIGDENVTELEVPDKIAGKSVISVGNAFSGGINPNLANLEHLILPDTVVGIGGEAFFSCKNLSRVDLPENLQGICAAAFEFCESLTYLDLPDSLTLIEVSAFAQSGLEDITIPHNVTKIGMNAFYRCENLQWITFEGPITAIPEGMCSGCSSLCEVEGAGSVETVGMLAFSDCTSLYSIDLGGVRELELHAFSGCEALEYVDLGNIETIGEYAFSSSGLQSAYFGPGLKTIGANAFSYCQSLAYMELPEGLERIGLHAFIGCDQLAPLSIPEGTQVETL